MTDPDLQKIIEKEYPKIEKGLPEPLRALFSRIADDTKPLMYHHKMCRQAFGKEVADNLLAEVIIALIISSTDTVDEAITQAKHVLKKVEGADDKIKRGKL